MADHRYITDPVEQVVASGLFECGVAFVHETKGDTKRLDFYLPDFNVYIECKRFHSDRISEQMSRVDNVISIQGMDAAKTFAKLITTNTEKGMR